MRGATYSLLLPDGRAAVVNCESKFAEHMAGPAGNKRSCRMPIVDDIQADSSGDKTKLSWPVASEPVTREQRGGVELVRRSMSTLAISSQPGKRFAVQISESGPGRLASSGRLLN